MTPIQATGTPIAKTVAAEIAAVKVATESFVDPTPRQSSTSNNEGDSTNLAIWVVGIGLLVLAMLTVGYLVRRKGE